MASCQSEGCADRLPGTGRGKDLNHSRAEHSAKVHKGFSGATVSEVVEDHDGSTYRAVYTVRFADVVYVLHVFQKKSKSGISTPKHEIDKIKARLEETEITYANHIEEIASQRDEESWQRVCRSWLSRTGTGTDEGEAGTTSPRVDRRAKAHANQSCRTLGDRSAQDLRPASWARHWLHLGSTSQTRHPTRPTYRSRFSSDESVSTTTIARPQKNQGYHRRYFAKIELGYIHHFEKVIVNRTYTEVSVLFGELADPVFLGDFLAGVALATVGRGASVCHLFYHLTPPPAPRTAS